jgi:hypothetical protein
VTLMSEIDVALELGRHLDALGVVWLVGGSVASSLLGEPRATADVDLVADLRLPHVEALVAALVETHYIDGDTVRWAVETRRTFNVIQLASMIKLDVYCSEDDELSRGQLARRQWVTTASGALPIACAEDVILRKLMWFRAGGGVSDRQWRDLIGVVRVNRTKLDRALLDHHADAQGVADLLAKLLASAADP